MMRHAILLLLGVAAVAGASPIQVDGGAIDGVEGENGVRAWLGVPFAKPPLRGLRWKAPQPVEAWQGVRHTDRFAPECLQPLRGSAQNHYFGEEATSEDCLYLNIWAPAAAQKAPVIVWIYGGGFNIGSASMANYSGEPLARQGVVRVNIAYRVGPLGFLAHPELSREAGKGSGNYGLMDQIAALQWVKRNIAQFGGDPDNITIVGQSAGSMSVGALQISPLAKGLFEKLAGMSGSPFGTMMRPAPLARAEAQGLALQRELGAASIADMRTLPADRLTSARSPRDPLVLDGHVLTVTAEATFAARQQNDVPILIGYTRDESFRPLGKVESRAQLQEQLAARFPTAAEKITARYPGEAARAATDIARDASVGRQMAEWALHQQRYARNPAFAFFFQRRQPYAPGIRFSDHDPATAGAYHSGDVPYWLGTLPALNLFRTTRNWEAGDTALEREMTAALLHFAATGKPASPTVGNWPAFDHTLPRLVRLDVESGVVPWPHFADMPLFAEDLPVQRPAGASPRD